MAGLDLDINEARVVELEGRPSAARLLRWGRMPLPEGAVGEGKVLQPQAVGQVLERLWQEHKIKSREVMLGLTNQDVLVRFATFPRLPGDKLEKFIRFQAEEYLPVSLEEAVVDYMVLGESGVTPEDRQLDVLLVAARREMLAGFLAALDGARLTPLDINVSVLSLLRLLPVGQDSPVEAVVNIGREYSNILVADGGVPRLARTVPLDLQKIQERLYSLEQEEDLEDEVVQKIWSRAALVDWSELLSGEIRASLGYYLAQGDVEDIGRILLCGLGTRVEGLPLLLQEMLEIEVDRLDPLEVLGSVPKVKGNSQDELLDYDLSISLALGGLEEKR